MGFTVKPNGEIVCETADEAVALARALAGGAGPPAAPVVGESISTDRWKAIHATDKRITAAVDFLAAHRQFFGDLTPLQRQACELRVAGKWPHEIATELGRTTGTVQAIIWDAGKRLKRRAKGLPLPTQAEISSMGGKAAKAKRDAARAEEPAPDPRPAPPARIKGARYCRNCGKPGHFAKTCKEQPAAAAPPPAPSEMLAEKPDARGEIIEESPTATPAKKRRACKSCGQPGHNARSCPSAAAPARDPVPAAPALGIQKGQRFTVAEDFEDDETGQRWAADDVWEAIEPAGPETEDGQPWRMWRPADGAEAVGYPGLHPFVADPGAGGPSLERDWRVGMRERAPEAAA
jgi:hypothetical protein